jgi:hypothetical protein
MARAATQTTDTPARAARITASSRAVGASAKPAAALPRIETTPSSRSISTEATDRDPDTPSRESCHARATSPPTLGRNAPMKLLSKKIRSIRWNGGRESAPSSAIQRYAMSARSAITSATAPMSQPGDTRAKAPMTADGFDCLKTTAAIATATTNRTMLERRQDTWRGLYPRGGTGGDVSGRDRAAASRCRAGDSASHGARAAGN